jgi:PAS domain S-box-containing protein
MTDTFPTPARSPDLAPGRVLVVDDDPAVRRLVLHTLTTTGYYAIGAASAEDALPLLPQGDFDVALVDLDLPGRSGVDFLGEIPPALGIVPVLLTGTSDVRLAVAAMKLAFDYLPKPVDMDDVRWAVGRALDVARTQRRGRLLERVATEWEATFDACPDPLLVLGADKRILRANRATERLAGLPPDGLSGQFVCDIFPNELGATMVRCLDATRICPPLVRVSDSATGRHFLVSAHLIPTPSGASPAVVLARDVTTLHQAELAKTKLAHQLITAQEDERGRIARELHDGTGQSLASLAIGLNTIIETPPASGLRERLQTLWRIASDALEEVRRMARRFRPPMLDDHGLLIALGRLAEDFARLHEIRAELIVTTTPERRFPAPVELAVYRIVQEALANVVKHAGARTVDVLIESLTDEVHVSIADDGAGFDFAGSPPDGLGLSDMRERANMLGGTFRVDSTPDRGTTIDVRIPLREEAP